MNETYSPPIEDSEDTPETGHKELWEIYDQEDFEPAARHGGAGGRKPRKPDSLTSQEARSNDVRNAQERRRDEAKDRIGKVVAGFPKFPSIEAGDKFVEAYAKWLKDSWNLDYLIQDPDQELEYRYVRSGAKAGGQNVNKVSSAVICKHLRTTLYARNEETRDQHINKTNATAELEKSLGKHLKDWKTLVSSPEDITLDLIKGMLANNNEGQ